MLDYLAAGYEKAFRAVSEMFGAPVSTYCKLETADRIGTDYFFDSAETGSPAAQEVQDGAENEGDAGRAPAAPPVHSGVSESRELLPLNVLVADDGSYISMYRLEGSLQHVGSDEYASIVGTLAEKFLAYLNKPGHLLQVVFECDPEDGAAHTHDLIEPSRISSRNLGLDLDGIFEDLQRTLRKYVTREVCTLVLWTRPQVLPDSMRKTAVAERMKNTKKLPYAPGCQDVGRTLKDLQDAHSGYASGVEEAFRQCDLLIHALDAHEALREIRLGIDREFTSRSWRPLLPGDSLPIRLPDEGSGILSGSLFPSLREQLFPREGEILGRNAVRIGDRIYAPVVMTLCPQTPKPFF
jgi:intracellular multiplication protein IcmB